MTPTQAQDLKRLAEAATPGPWKFSQKWADHVDAEDGDVCMLTDNLFTGFTRPLLDRRNNGAYLAAMSPDVALQLLADRAMLLKLLEEATDDAEYYCQYAGEYLVDKHGIKDRIAEYRAAIAQIEGTQP